MQTKPLYRDPPVFNNFHSITKSKLFCILQVSHASGPGQSLLDFSICNDDKDVKCQLGDRSFTLVNFNKAFENQK